MLTLLLKQVDFTRCNLFLEWRLLFVETSNDFGFLRVEECFLESRGREFLSHSVIFYEEKYFFSCLDFFFSRRKLDCVLQDSSLFLFRCLVFHFLFFPFPFLFLLCKIISSVRPSCSVSIKLGGWNLVFDCRGLKSIILCLILTDKFLIVTAPP